MVANARGDQLGWIVQFYLPQEVEDDAKVAMIAIKHMVALLIHTRAFVIPR